MRRRNNNQGVIIFCVYITLLCSLPLILYVLIIPLKILNVIGTIGVSIFGEGNGALFIIVLMLMFAGVLAVLIKILDKK